MKSIKSLFSKIAKFFTSGKAEAAFNTVADLVPRALPIVEQIAALTRNKTDDQIAAAYAHYGVPLWQTVMTVPASERGGLLLKLATEVLQERYPGVKVNIIQSAIQLAVTMIKAEKEQ